MPFFCWLVVLEKHFTNRFFFQHIHFCQGPPASNSAQVEEPPSRPVITPCRSESAIPELNDRSQPEPVPGVVRISKQAADSRLRRVFTPNIKGEYKVPMEIVKQWQSGKKNSRTSLTQIFQSCGFDPDTGF